MSSAEEQEYIWGKLIPELQSRMEGWAAEYKQPRELGAAGEFVGLHRKTMKLKTIVWDGVDASDWREDPETILFEVVAHALLMLYDVRHSGHPRMVNSEPQMSLEDPDLVRKLADEYEEVQRAKVPQSQRTHEFRGQTHHNHPGKTCEEWWMLTEEQRHG